MAPLTQTPAVLQQLALDQIDPHPNNPRLVEAPAFAAYLTSEMRTHGFPEHYAGLFRRKPDGRYQTISAHRRVEGARAAGLTIIPGWVADLTDEEALLALSKSNMQEGLTKLELAVHSLCVERASGKRGQGLKAFADQHQVDDAALSRYRRGAEVFTRVRQDLEAAVVAGCLDRAEHLARIRKAPEADWTLLVTGCVRDDWSINRTREEVAARLTRLAPDQPPTAPEDVGDGVDNNEASTPGPERTVDLELHDDPAADETSTLSVANFADAERQQTSPPSDGNTNGVDAPTLVDVAAKSQADPAVDTASSPAGAERATIETTLGKYYEALSFEKKLLAFCRMWVAIVQQVGTVPGRIHHHLNLCEEPTQVGECLRSLEAIIELILGSPDLSQEVQALRDLAKCFGPAVAPTTVETPPQIPAATPKPPAKARRRATKKARHRKSA